MLVHLVLEREMSECLFIVKVGLFSLGCVEVVEPRLESSTFSFN